MSLPLSLDFRRIMNLQAVQTLLSITTAVQKLPNSVDEATSGRERPSNWERNLTAIAPKIEGDKLRSVSRLLWLDDPDSTCGSPRPYTASHPPPQMSFAVFKKFI